MKTNYRAFVSGIVIGAIVMAVFMTIQQKPVKDASYWKGQHDGTFGLARQLIVDLAKR